MKILLIACSSALLFGCNSKALNTIEEKTTPQIVYAQPEGKTVYVDTTIYLTARHDSLLIARLKKTNDSLYSKLLLANYKIEKVKYYLAICTRNPSQKKFLFGWMRRAVQ